MFKRLFSKGQNTHELIDSLYLIATQGINQFLPLLVMPYLMQTLGASGYGKIGFALSVVQYFTLVVDFGFNLSATKRIAIVKENPTELNKVFWSVVWAKTLLLFLSLLATFLLVCYVSTFNDYGIVILCTLPMLIGTAFTFLWFFQGIGKVRIMAIINTISKLTLLPLIFVFVKSDDDVLLASLLQSTVFVLTALISSVVLWKMNIITSPLFDFPTIKKEIQDSFPLFLSSASTSVYTHLFVIILGFYCLPDAVGRYASAEKIMRALCFLLYIPVNQAFFPRISTLSTNDKRATRQTFYQLRNIIVALMLIISLILFFLLPPLVAFLGSDYKGLDTLLRFIAFTPLFIGIGGVYGQAGLIAMGDKNSRRHFRNVYFGVACTALPLAFLLTNIWQEFGAAVAMVIAEFLVFIAMIYYCRKDLAL